MSLPFALLSWEAWRLSSCLLALWPLCPAITPAQALPPGSGQPRETLHVPWVWEEEQGNGKKGLADWSEDIRKERKWTCLTALL